MERNRERVVGADAAADGAADGAVTGPGMSVRGEGAVA